jgi:hypothetical protein
LTLAPPSFWTEADAGELDVLVDAFVGAVLIHREGCAVCSSNRRWCRPLEDCFEGILDWRRSRALRSKAAWLRARQTAREEVVS